MCHLSQLILFEKSYLFNQYIIYQILDVAAIFF